MAAEKIARIHAFEGLIAPPFTPYKTNGELNAEIIPKYVEHLVNNGVKGVFLNGTSGEGVSLTVAERKTIAEAWVRSGRDKLEVIIVQVGANSIKDAKELAAHAEEIGATAIASLPPLFYKPQTDDHLIAYLKKIADAAPTLPLMLYHIPAYSGVELQLGEFLPKARKAIPTMCGAKYTSTEMRDLLNIQSLPGKPFKIFSGYDEVLLPCLACGVTAAVGATYNFMAPFSLRLLEAFKKGDLDAARKIQFQILNAVLTLSRNGQAISSLKAVMNLLGPLDVGSPRIPLVPLTTEQLSVLKEDLKELKSKGVA